MQEKMLHTYDLVVLGGGLAGHTAALEAAAKGVSVLLLEKTSEFGGSTLHSSGSFAFAGTQAQRDAGFEDSPENMAQDVVKASGNLADPTLVQLFVDEQAAAYDWLLHHGVQFHPVTLSSNQGVPRTHATQPRQLMDALHSAARSNANIVYVDNAEATRLLTDEANQVSGVEVMLSGQATQVMARRGVVLATGGFSRNESLIRKFAPGMADAMRLGGSGNTGDGLVMAWKLGADVLDVAFVNGTFGISLNHYPQDIVPDAEEALLRLAIYRGGIAVNTSAKRFADESISYKVLGELCLKQSKGIAFQLWDQKVMDQSVPAPNATDFQSAYDKGLVKSAPTLEALAQTVGLDPGQLAATVDQYNHDVDEGRDSVFGRTSLGKGWGKLARLDTAPYYIYPCTTAILATYCGLRVSPRMEVLDVYGERISKLYAAGEIVGGFHGSGYMSGSSLTKSVVFGRAAAAAACERERVPV